MWPVVHVVHELAKKPTRGSLSGISSDLDKTQNSLSFFSRSEEEAFCDVSSYRIRGPPCGGGGEQPFLIMWLSEIHVSRGCNGDESQGTLSSANGSKRRAFWFF